MRVTLKSLLAAGLFSTALSLSAFAAPITISTSVNESGYADTQDQPSYPVTAPGAPYDFTGQAYSSLTSITSITVQLSVNDGDTGPGQFDENQLTFALNGHDTGLVLNGFISPGIYTLSFTGLPALAATILTELKLTGTLVGSVIDHDPANAPAGSGGDFIGFPSFVETTLSITGDAAAGPGGGGGNGVPLPAAVVLAPLGAGLAGMYSRRFRKA